MTKKRDVHRPVKRSEYVIRFGSNNAANGWRDLVATKRNAMADAWDWLTQTPRVITEKCYPLKGDLRTVVRDTRTYVQWQYKVPGGARIWYYVVEATSKQAGEVVLIRVATSHPNETK
ncbi:MAG: hypothetical protein K0U64_10030 [Actinomycetia bacterium]|nr:hypothetical protein [Actinomycetes bacterium]